MTIKDKNNNSFIISFYLKKNSIFIKGEEENDVTNLIYVNEMHIKDFQEINKFFMSFENISEIYEMIKEVEKEDFSVSKKEDFLEVSFNTQVMKKKIIIPIKLSKIKNNIDNVVTNLCEKIKEVEVLKEEIQYYKIEQEKLNLRMDIIEKEIKKSKELNLKMETIEKENRKLQENLNLIIDNVVEQNTKLQENLNIKIENIKKENSKLQENLELKMANNNKKDNLKSQDSLYLKIDNLEKENLKLKESFNLKIDSLEKENTKLKEQISVIDSVLGEEIKLKNNIYNSKIIYLPEEFQFINSCIKDRFNKEIKNINLLYRASKDGDNLQAFSSKCLDINDTLVLVKTKDGKKFGGFTHEKWPLSQRTIQDRFAFIFSLDNKEIYKIKAPYNAISYCNGYIITFGSLNFADFSISNNFMTNEKSFESISGSSYDFRGKEYPLNGKSNFKVNELEVFNLEY